MKDRDKVVSVTEGDGPRDPAVFIGLGIVLGVVGAIWLVSDGAPGVGWIMVVVGSLVALYGVIGSAVSAGIRSAWHHSNGDSDGAA